MSNGNGGNQYKLYVLTNGMKVVGKEVGNDPDSVTLYEPRNLIVQIQGNKANVNLVPVMHPINMDKHTEWTIPKQSILIYPTEQLEHSEYLVQQYIKATTNIQVANMMPNASTKGMRKN